MNKKKTLDEIVKHLNEEVFELIGSLMRDVKKIEKEDLDGRISKTHKISEMLTKSTANYVALQKLQLEKDIQEQGNSNANLFERLKELANKQ